MPITAEILTSDAATIVLKNPQGRSFGSGRRIAPGLILTAGHVVDVPSKDNPILEGWKVRLIKDRDRNGNWKAVHDAKVIWRCAGDTDLALLQIDDCSTPVLSVVFGSYELVAELKTLAVGFPEARWDVRKESKDYTVHGALRIAQQHGPFAWTTKWGDSPDKKNGWCGMSGAGVAAIDENEKVHLLGVIQEVPANFSDGQLSVARLANAFDDEKFIKYLTDALGTKPGFCPLSGGARRTIRSRDTSFVLVDTKVRKDKKRRWYAVKFQCKITDISFRIEKVLVDSKQRAFNAYYMDKYNMFHKGLIAEAPCHGCVLETQAHTDDGAAILISFVDSTGIEHGPFSLSPE